MEAKKKKTPDKKKPVKKMSTTKILQAAFLTEMFNNLGNISKSCKTIGINRATYYDWAKDEEFQIKLSEIEEAVIDYVESKLIELMSINATAAIYFLKTKGKKRGWQEENKLDVNITSNKIKFEFGDTDTPEEQENEINN